VPNVRFEVPAVGSTRMILWDVKPPDFPDKPAALFRVEEQSHLEMGTLNIDHIKFAA
jgi:hypothetical protein